MKKLKVIFYCMLVVWATSCANITSEIYIGDKYLFSFDFDEPDPFKQTEIDTAYVLKIKGNYIKFKLSSGMESSCTKRLFRELTMPCN